MTKFKDCWCGKRIPAEWSECGECLSRGVRTGRGDHRLQTATRRLTVQRRVVRGKSLQETLNAIRVQTLDDYAKETEADEFLVQRRLKKLKQAKRAKRVLREWGALDHEDDE